MRPTTVYCYSPSLLSVPSVDRASPSLVSGVECGVEIFTHMHFSSCHTVRQSVSRHARSHVSPATLSVTVRAGETTFNRISTL